MHEPQGWQPDIGTVKQLLGFLEDGLDASRPEAQKIATSVGSNKI